MERLWLAQQLLRSADLDHGFMISFLYYSLSLFLDSGHSAGITSTSEFKGQVHIYHRYAHSSIMQYRLHSSSANSAFNSRPA